MQRECPHPRCDRKIEISMFACGQHWRTLPYPIRNGINDAYRRYSHGNAELGVLLDAQQEAVDHWAKP